MRKRQKKKNRKRRMAASKARFDRLYESSFIMTPLNWRRDDFDPKDYEFKVRSYYKPPTNFIAYGKHWLL